MSVRRVFFFFNVPSMNLIVYKRSQPTFRRFYINIYDVTAPAAPFIQRKFTFVRYECDYRCRTEVFENIISIVLLDGRNLFYQIISFQDILNFSTSKHETDCAQSFFRKSKIRHSRLLRTPCGGWISNNILLLLTRHYLN